MVLKGLIDFTNPEKLHTITSAVEHPAILNPALFLMELGVNVTILPVDHSCIESFFSSSPINKDSLVENNTHRGI